MSHEEQPGATAHAVSPSAGRIPRKLAQLIACIVAILPVLACAILLTFLAG